MGTKRIIIKLPENISDETKKFMQLVLRELSDKKVLSAYDFGNMRTLADSYEQYIQASTMLQEDGAVQSDDKGKLYLHPAERLRNASYSRYMQIMTEYGLTPKSQKKVSTPVDAEAEDSPLRSLLKNGK